MTPSAVIAGSGKEAPVVAGSVTAGEADAPRLTATGLSKNYGAFRLTDVGIDVHAGRVLGFFGPNGSGKTTTLAILAGLVRPDAGSIHRVAGPSGAGRQPMSVLLDSFGHNPFLTGREHLRTVARRFGHPASRVDEVLEEAGIASAARRRIGKYSLGMRRRLSIAEVLLVDAEVVLLDEPTNGLDPDGIVWLRRVIRRMVAEGRAVLLSSHMLNEAEGLIDDAVFLLEGRVEWAGPYQDVVTAVAERYVGLRSTTNVFELAEHLAARGVDVLQAGPDELAVRVEQVPQARKAVAELGHGASIVDLGRPNLDLVYHLIRSHGLRNQEVS
ncbi:MULTISPECIES: ABC transporter ATP-binding protein [Actinomyces]|uniref:ABC transporter ATP-binding protein n=1 Tax=Actinomyces respiraculi TaxID=2744574 RepID=A0A7T0LKN7_9ACTO|nr:MULTISPECIES: ABC transporter ATP-binding protein [Actinomyces]QPL05564.1 ABC transporter ATP-binding protein [Actinomyces respiraculi]